MCVAVLAAACICARTAALWDQPCTVAEATEATGDVMVAAFAEETVAMLDGQQLILEWTSDSPGPFTSGPLRIAVPVVPTDHGHPSLVD